MLVYSFVGAQVPDTLWTRTYCGPDSSSYVNGRVILPTYESGYLIVGTDGTTGYGNVFIIRTDSIGDTLWTRIYGNNNRTEDIWDVISTSDSGYIMIGNSFLPSTDIGLYVLKIDQYGDSLWARIYGGNETDAGFSIIECEDAGFIMAGYTKSFSPDQRDDVYIIRTDSIGDTLWTKTYGGSLGDRAYSMVYTEDSCYLLVGGTSSFGIGSSDVYLIKINQFGDFLWARTYGDSSFDRALDIKTTLDNNYIIVGETTILGQGSLDGYILKISLNGDTLWTNTTGGVNNEMFYSVQSMNDGYVIVGITTSYGPNQENAYIVCTDSLGNATGFNVYGGDYSDALYSIKPTEDGNFIAAGKCEYIDPTTYGIWLLKIGIVSEIEEDNDRCLLYPNTYISTFQNGTIKLPKNKSYKIFDITGRQIYTLDPAPGIYFIEVDGKIIHKTIKIK